MKCPNCGELMEWSCDYRLWECAEHGFFEDEREEIEE